MCLALGDLFGPPAGEIQEGIPPNGQCVGLGETMVDFSPQHPVLAVIGNGTKGLSPVQDGGSGNGVLEFSPRASSNPSPRLRDLLAQRGEEWDLGSFPSKGHWLKISAKANGPH